jgi:hypothetical protein
MDVVLPPPGELVDTGVEIVDTGPSSGGAPSRFTR